MLLNLSNLKNPFKKSKKRVGRGESSRGKTAGKGSKGQKARGKDMPRGFEGGQTPLKWRLPKLKGFKSKKENKIGVVALAKIEKKFSAQEIITPQKLKEKGLVRKDVALVKIIGNKAKKKFKVKGCLLSKGARKALKI